MNVLSDIRRLQVDPSAAEEPLGLDHILWTGSVDQITGPDHWTGSLDHTKTTIGLQVLLYKPLFQRVREIELIHPAAFFPPRLAALPPLRRAPPSYLAASAFVNDFKERVNRAEHPGRRYPGGAPHYGSGRYVAQCTFSFSFSPLFLLPFFHSFSFGAF